QTLINSVLITTDENGDHSSVQVPMVGAQPGDYITATATDASNNTSEFSNAQAVILAGEPPVAELITGNVVHTAGSTITFQVQFTGDAAIDITTLSSANIRVLGPNGFDQLAVFDGVDDQSNGSPRVATYHITAPD